jgi:hypothetical protein
MEIERYIIEPLILSKTIYNLRRKIGTLFASGMSNKKGTRLVLFGKRNENDSSAIWIFLHKLIYNELIEDY